MTKARTGTKSDLIGHLQGADEPLPVYLLAGDNLFQVEYFQRKLIQTGLGSGLKDFNLNRYQGGEDPLAPALDVARTLPMMADRRVVAINGIEKIKAKDLTSLIEYAANPNPSTLMVLAGPRDSGKGKLANAVNKGGGWVEVFGKIFEKDMGAWLDRITSDLGISLKPSARSFLIRTVGADPTKAATELAKANIYSGGKGEITEEDLTAVMAAAKSENIFDLADAVGRKEMLAASYLLYRILDDGNSPLLILAQLTRHMQRLLLVKHMLKQRQGAQSIASELGIPPFAAERLVAQARNFQDDEILNKLIRLAKADMELKSNRVSDKLVLEKVFRDLCR